MRRFLSVLLTVLFAFSIVPVVYAADDYNRYSEYLGYIEEGILGDDISYEVWLELVETNNKLINSLEDSSQFKLIYSGRSSGLSSLNITTGDVLITNDPHTAVAGMIGHSAIVRTSDIIVHIADSNSHPDTLSRNEWISNYDNGETKVYRHNDSGVASRAAIWAYTTYILNNSDAAYGITTDLYSFNPTYCSKIVWQAFYYVAPVGSYVYIPTPLYVIGPGSLPGHIPGLVLNGTYGAYGSI